MWNKHPPRARVAGAVLVAAVGLRSARAVAAAGLAAGLLAAAVLAGCASGIPRHTSDQELRDRYAAYAGPPINEFTWLGHFYSWEALGKTELVVFTTPSDAYLLKVWPPCDLRFDFNRIEVTSTSGMVSSGLDAVIEHSAATGRLRCPISEIRKVDYRRMMADQRQKRQPANAAANPNAAPSPNPTPPPGAPSGQP
jgi:Family of unknown function (DUF6491)